MSHVLRILLEITVYSAILTAAIILFKKVFAKHISAMLNYAVWALLILRLLMPMTVDSGFSLFVIPQNSPQMIQTQATDEPVTLNSIQEFSVHPSQSSQAAAEYQEPAGYPKDSTESVSVTEPEIQGWKIDWQTALVIIWLGGALIFGIYMLRIRFFLRQNIKRSCLRVPEETLKLIEHFKRQMGIKAQIEVSAHDWLTTPALSASIKPRLLLPAHMLNNAEQLSFGICHELTHLKRRDYLASLLMIVLRCVYWFNPVVWLAFRQMETDMETACDVSVTLPMKNTERGRYIKTMIELSREPRTQYVLGMGTHVDRKSVEKRIRGIFMTKKTAPAARTMAALLACLMLVVCFTTACQPTPETAPVVYKGDDHLEDMIASSAASPLPTATPDPAQSEKEQEEVLRQALMERLGAPETIEDSFVNDKGDVTVTIDAKVEVPAVQSIPAAKVKASGFSQDTVDKFAAYFFGDSPLFEEENVETKEEIEAQIIEIKRNMSSDTVAMEGDNGTEQWLKDLEEKYKNAPEEKERKPASTQLKKTEYAEEVKVVADLGKDDMAELEVYNEGWYCSLRYYNDGKGQYVNEFDPTSQSVPKGVEMTREDAETMVMQCLNDLGLGDIQIDTASISTFRDLSFSPTDKQCYTFSLKRMYHGIPVTNVEASTQMDTDDPNAPASKEPEYTKVMEPERFTVNVDDTGIVGFEWYHPIVEETVLSENVELKPFNEIAQKAKENIFFKNYTAYGSECRIEITSVKLGMMRIMSKDNPSEYLMVPVWDFIGNSETIIEGKSFGWLPFDDQSYVTINAIDGSLINRQWGY